MRAARIIIARAATVIILIVAPRGLGESSFVKGQRLKTVGLAEGIFRISRVLLN